MPSRQAYKACCEGITAYSAYTSSCRTISSARLWMLFIRRTQYLLGIRPVWDGLLIDPCLPADWPEITVDRMFRGCRYHIVIRNMEKTVFLPHVEGRKEYFAEI